MLKRLLLIMSVMLLWTTCYGSQKDETVIKNYLIGTVDKGNTLSLDKEVKIREVNFLNSKKVDEQWTGYYVSMRLMVLEGKKKSVVPVSFVLFTDGKVVTKDLAIPGAQDIASGLLPAIIPSMYNDEHFLAGHKNAKHKLVVFSDPICPACRNALPKILNKVRSNPDEFVLYYYHFPLENLHPQAPSLVKGMIALQRMGKKGIVDQVYTQDIKSLGALNKVYGSIKITQKDIKHYNYDLKMVEKLAVSGTPTLYYDGEIDQYGKKFFNK